MAMQFVMLSEFCHSSPCPILPRARCSVSTSHQLLPAPGGSAGVRSPSSCTDPDPEPRSRLLRSRGGGSSSPPPPLPGARGDAGAAEPQSLEEDGESWVQVFLPGILWADGNGESFISPCCRSEGVGRGRPRKFSFCHHRTKNRMSTTSKMTKRTTIAHHCRRSGKKRKHQSSCFRGEGKLGEHFFFM